MPILSNLGNETAVIRREAPGCLTNPPVVAFPSPIVIKDGKLIKVGTTKEITNSEDLESVFLELTNEE